MKNSALAAVIRSFVPQHRSHYGSHDRLNFTNPKPGCFYLSILDLLHNGDHLTKDQIYSSIPGTRKETYCTWGPKGNTVYQKKWINGGILTALVAAGLVTRIGKEYQLAELGYKYLNTLIEATLV